MDRGDRENERISNFELLDSEIYHDGSYALSLPSQPPDIRNWFSSYESQQFLDPINGVDLLLTPGQNENEIQDPIEDSRKRKLQECLSPEKIEPELHKVKKKLSLRKILGDEFLTSCQKTIADRSISPERVKKIPRSENLDRPKTNNSEEKSDQEELNIKYQEPSTTNSKNRKENLIPHAEEKPNENTTENKLKSEKKNSDSGGFRRRLFIDKTNLANKDRGGCFRGNLGKGDDDDDVPIERVKKIPRGENLDRPKTNNSKEKSDQEELNIKNRKENLIPHAEENSNENTTENCSNFIKPRQNLHHKKVTKIKVKSEKKSCDSGGFRRPFVDKTNLANKDRAGCFRGNLGKTEYSVDDAVPTEGLSCGKWQCPRKRKPYMGPPLKQLGLEKWIQRSS